MIFFYVGLPFICFCLTVQAALPAVIFWYPLRIGVSVDQVSAPRQGEQCSIKSDDQSPFLPCFAALLSCWGAVLRPCGDRMKRH